jgi:hypothetical protein
MYYAVVLLQVYLIVIPELTLHITVNCERSSILRH